MPNCQRARASGFTQEPSLTALLSGYGRRSFSKGAFDTCGCPTARAARTPRIPIAVPSASDTAVRARWTAKNPVIPSCHDLESFQMFFRKTGQITQLHTAKAIRNQAMRLEIYMVEV